MFMIDEVLYALAEPRRRRLLWLIRKKELSSGDLAAHFADVTRPAISQHLRVLEQAGLVQVRRQGTRRLYRANPYRLAELRAYLEAFWEDRLSDLKDAAEAEEKRRKERWQRKPVV